MESKDRSIIVKNSKKFSFWILKEQYKVSITNIKYKVKKILTIFELLSLIKTRLEKQAKILVFKRITNRQHPTKTIWVATSKSSTGKLYFKLFIIWIVYNTCKKITKDKKSSGKYDLNRMESI